MYQLKLFQDKATDRVINVASVPQRSPFRYPGGKTWLVPYIREWLFPPLRQALGLTPQKPVQFIEPFAGGGIVGLTVAAEKLAEHVTMVEIDEDVAAVWKTILEGENWKWLVQEIISFDLTEANADAYLARIDTTLQEHAFRTILRNRINRGGILAQGAGRIKNGEGGKGMRSRWYPATLAKRIREIVKIRSSITFVHSDGMQILEEKRSCSDAVFFIDPPYTIAGKRAGKRLYTHAEVDHERLFALTSQLEGDFLMTYDDTDEVRSLASRFGLDMECVFMKNTHHAQIRELLIGRNLNWLRETL